MANRPLFKRQLNKGKTPKQGPSVSLLEVFSKAEQFERVGDRKAAIQCYRDWLGMAPPATAWAGWYQLGNLLQYDSDINGAIDAYQKSVASNIKATHPRINLGAIFDNLGRFDEAILQWEAALSLLEAEAVKNVELLSATLNNLGRQYEAKGKLKQAEDMLVRSLLIKPKQEKVLYHRIFLRKRSCEWPIYAPLPGISEEDQRNATSALSMLSISDDPEIQFKAALNKVFGEVPKDLPRLAPEDGYSHDRLRIGYLSADFQMHAVSILTAELYELHDRKRFEVWAFCMSSEDGSKIRSRVIGAMDHVVRINDLSDEAVAKAIRAAEIDILVDLQGPTLGVRPAILAYQPAPVQISYLGFPGTCGLSGVDYILADRYVLPDKALQYYTEKPLYLPDCFQINDRQRSSLPPRSRAEYGLPENAFVFCAFNNNHKLTPEMFATWMRILERTENTVLWLLADNPASRENLVRHAGAFGFAEDRVIFASKVPFNEYLGRFGAADLFLDLFPFNGGTTAADALWMGLPILTCSGRSFASRMAGSLLNAIGLPELITTSLHDYEELAVSLAGDPDKVKELKTRLRNNRDTYPLFDSPKTVRAIEGIFESVAKRGGSKDNNLISQ